MKMTRTMSSLWPLGAALLLMGGPACDGSEDPDTTVLPEYCNPLSTDSCILPWPSSYYLKADASTETGFRLSYPLEAMPKNRDGVPIDPTRYNLLDGFSIGSQILTYFAQGLSDDGLPTDQQDYSGSVSDQSLVWVVEHPGGERVPLYVELDANVKGAEVPTLIIRPQTPLKHNTRYVVALRRGIKDASGALLEAPEPFARLRDGRGTSSEPLDSMREEMEQVLDFLATQGAPRDDLVLAWDFHTTSHAAVTSNVLGMVDEALAKLPADGPAIKIVETKDFTPAENANLLREIHAEMTVPSYLESDGLDSWLKLDPQGKPIYRGEQSFDFWVHIPRCAETATAPLPVEIYGAGLFANPQSEMSQDFHTKMSEELCMVAAAARWPGLSNLDSAAVAAQVIPDFSNLPRVTDRLQQAHVNAQMLAEVMAGKLLSDPAMQVGGKPVTDGKEMYYVGLSGGAIQGVAFAALSKRIKRFVLHVGGGWWSVMIPRSSQFDLLAILSERVYPEALERQVLISLTQHLWDYTDPISYAGNLLGTPLAGRDKKLVLLQESEDDDHVPNLATRGVARAIGLPQLTPNVEPVYGLEQKSGPLQSGLAQWNVDPPIKPPKENIPAQKVPGENNAHNKPRTLASFRAQLKGFLKADGSITNPCEGACDPE